MTIPRKCVWLRESNDTVCNQLRNFVKQFVGILFLRLLQNPVLCPIRPSGETKALIPLVTSPSTPGKRPYNSSQHG